MPIVPVAVDIYDRKFPAGVHRHIRLDPHGRPVFALWLPNDPRLIDPATGLPRGFHRRVPRFEERVLGLPGLPRIRKKTAVARGPLTVHVSAATGTTTASLNAHLVGDLHLGMCWRSGSTTPPSIPGDFTSIAALTGGSTNQSTTAAWRIADTTSETSGTWSNSTRLIIASFRGAHQTSPIGNTGGPNSQADGLIDWPAITLTSGEANLSAFVLFACVRDDAAIIPTPTGFSLGSSLQVTAGEGVCNFFYDLSVSASYGGQTNSNTTSAARWRSIGMELKAA